MSNQVNTKASKKIPKILEVVHLFVLLASILLVVAVSLELFNLLPWLTPKHQLTIQLWVCIVFLLDFFVSWYYAPVKHHYLIKNFAYLIVSIPYLNIFQYSGFDFIYDHLYYFLRLIPLLRGGYALFMLITWLTKNRISSLFFTYLSILGASIYFCTMIFFSAEKDVNPDVHTIGDAFWWSSMSVTTLGEGIVAVTPTGKIATIVIAIVGVLMFPIFTVFITDRIQKHKSKHKSTEEDKQEDGDDV